MSINDYINLSKQLYLIVVNEKLLTREEREALSKASSIIQTLSLGKMTEENA